MSALRELVALLESLPVGAAVDEALKARLLEKARAIGTGEPLRAEGSGYEALGRELLGSEASFHPAPAGPYEPPPPPPPRAFKPPPAGED